MSHTQPTSSSRQRGIAMVLVLVVVAAVSVMAYGLLASASTGTQIASASTLRLQRQYLAESGLNLAYYYLQNPDASPVSRVYGDWGNVHYPGEQNITLGQMPGTLSISVINVANGVFKIESIATLQGDTHRASASIKLDKYRTFDRGAHFLTNVTLGNRISISGGLSTLGNLTLGASAVTGLLTASNGPSLGGTVAPANEVSDYPISMNYYLPYYFKDGKRYTAKRLTNGFVFLTLFDTDVVNNPYNVWYADTNVQFFLTNTINGSLITRNGRNVTVQGDLTVTPHAGLPALVVDGNLTISGAGRTVNLNGLTYVRDQITSTTSASNNQITINGVFVSGNRTTSPMSNYKGYLNIIFNPQRATVQAMMDEVEPIHNVTIQSWKTTAYRSTP